MDLSPDFLLLNNTFLVTLDLVSVFVMAIAAGALARRLQFDAVGFIVLGIVAGLGGGIIRDLILAQGVPAAFSNPLYLSIGVVGSLFAYLFSSQGRIWRISTIVLDCVAMGLWAAIGTAKSTALGLDPLPAILLGVTTAVGGGVLRDIMVGRTPAIFGGEPIYATAAAITAILTRCVYFFHLPGWTVLIASLTGTVIGVCAHWKKWLLPGAPDLSVTMSPAQLKAFTRRIRRSERARVARETGGIPVVDVTPEPLVADALEIRITDERTTH